MIGILGRMAEGVCRAMLGLAFAILNVRRTDQSDICKGSTKRMTASSHSHGRRWQRVYLWLYQVVAQQLSYGVCCNFPEISISKG